MTFRPLPVDRASNLVEKGNCLDPDCCLGLRSRWLLPLSGLHIQRDKAVCLISVIRWYVAVAERRRLSRHDCVCSTACPGFINTPLRLSANDHSQNSKPNTLTPTCIIDHPGPSTFASLLCKSSNHTRDRSGIVFLPSSPHGGDASVDISRRRCGGQGLERSTVDGRHPL